MERNNSVIKELIINRRYRLITSLVIALIIFLISKNPFPGIVSFMFTWVGFGISNLFFSWFIILSYHPAEVKAIAREEDWGSTLIFSFVLIASFIGLFAIFFLLKSIPDETKKTLNLHILLSIMSVFCSWTLIHTLFTLKYAHKYYGTGNGQDDDNLIESKGLEFPNEKEPDYLDFAYFSFGIGMTFQVSDVQITSRNIRRLSLVHSLLSFVYNTVIVALSINIISGLISK